MNKYIRDNISLRKASSFAKSEFLQAEHYYLELITTGSFIFDDITRQIVLLYYDNFFKFVIRLERYFIFTENNLNQNYIFAEFRSTFTDIYDIMRSNPIEFGDNDNYIKQVQESNDIILDALGILCKNLQGMNTDEIFIKIINFTNLYIQDLIHILHEIQNLKTQLEPPFLSMTSYIFQLLPFGIFGLTHRANLYRKFYGVNHFVIKKYIDIPDSCIENLEQNNFTLAK